MAYSWRLLFPVPGLLLSRKGTSAALRLAGFSRLLPGAAACVIFAASAGTGSGQESGARSTQWRILLRQQLLSEKQCDLHIVSQLRDFELGGEQKIEGRAVCADGREFTFSRPQPHMKFDLRLCEPAFC